MILGWHFLRISKEERDKQKKLRDLARIFFHWRSEKFHEYEVEENVELTGISGKRHKFDFFLKHGDNPFLSGIGVIIKDWISHCNFQVVLRAENSMKDCQAVHKTLVISNDFSQSARDLHEPTGVLLLSRGELISMFRQNMVDFEN